MNRTPNGPETATTQAASSQAAMLKQIGFHGSLVMFTALLIAAVLKAF